MVYKSKKMEYEKLLLNEIQDLPEAEIAKIIKIIHFLKEEILDIKKRKDDDLRLFLRSYGSWKDERTPKEIINEIYESRKSKARDIQL